MIWIYESGNGILISRMPECQNSVSACGFLPLFNTEVMKDF